MSIADRLNVQWPINGTDISSESLGSIAIAKRRIACRTTPGICLGLEGFRALIRREHAIGRRAVRASMHAKRIGYNGNDSVDYLIVSSRHDGEMLFTKTVSANGLLLPWKHNIVATCLTAAQFSSSASKLN